MAMNDTELLNKIIEVLNTVANVDPLDNIPPLIDADLAIAEMTGYANCAKDLLKHINKERKLV
jgi:hypothetical protein